MVTTIPKSILSVLLLDSDFILYLFELGIKVLIKHEVRFRIQVYSSRLISKQSRFRIFPLVGAMSITITLTITIIKPLVV